MSAEEKYPIDEQTHERLCAWLMGEVDADEARSLQEACAASPALEAERVRLASTIGLVQGSLQEEPSLSDSVMERLLASAGGGQVIRHPWWQQPSLRAAAGIMALLGGVSMVVAIQGRTADLTSNMELAVAPADESMRARERASAQVGRAGGTGRLGVGPDSESRSGSLELEVMEGELTFGRAGADPGEPEGLELPNVKLSAEDIPDQNTWSEITEEEVEEAEGVRLEFDAVQVEALAEGGAGIDGAGAVGGGRATAPGASLNAGPASPGPASPPIGGAGGAPGASSGPGQGASANSNEGLAGSAAPAIPKHKTEAAAIHEKATDRSLQTDPHTGSDDFFLGRSVDDSGKELKDRERDGVRPRSLVDLGLTVDPGDVAGDLEALTERYALELFNRCAVRPGERPRDMYFRFYGDNPFEYAPKDPRSTFSVDVDTASYALARGYLNEGVLPERAQVRTEEFVNYLQPDLAPPAEGTFAIHTELGPSRFGDPGHYMLRVGLRGKEVSREERPPMALTFVVDVSGSMNEGGRLDLVKHGLRLLLTQLDARDRIALVAFSKEARLILPMTPATQGAVVEAALHPLKPNGGTNAEAGLKLGYEVARTAVDPSVTSRVIFLSDGVANLGQTDQDQLVADVRGHREQGIYLNTIGVGMNNHSDVFLERLADQGDGVCDYLDSPKTAKRALVDRFTGALVPIASDVKVQVVFDPARVARYRLLGYENRAIADEDFENDAVDAGEVGAGHQVVALYELELAAQPESKAGEASAQAGGLATVKLRWKEPKRTGQHPLEVQVFTAEEVVGQPQAALGDFSSNDLERAAGFEETSPGYRRSTLVAQFAELLRRSSHARGDSAGDLLAEAEKLAPTLADPEFDEFVQLVRRAEPLLVAERVRMLQDELGMTVEEYRRLIYNRALLAELGELERREGLVDEIRRANEQIEGRIRDLIRDGLRGR